MGFRFKIAPGVRIRVSSRGVGVGAGPRIARINVSNRGLGVSSGVGPFQGYQHLGGGTRRRSGGGPSYAQTSVAAYQRQVREAQRTAEISAVDAVDRHLASLQEAHLQAFSEVTPPAARSGDEVGFDTQAEADAAWDALRRNDEAAVISSIERAYEDNAVPAVAIGCEDDTVMIVMMLAEPADLIPDRCAGETPAGRPTIHKRTKTEVNDEYLYLLASNALATVKEAFASAPAINRCRIVVVSRASADRESLLTPLYCGVFTRSALAAVKWKKIDAVEMIDDADESLLEVYGRTNEVVPLDLTDHADVAATLATIADHMALTLDPDSAPEDSESGDSELAPEDATPGADSPAEPVAQDHEEATTDTRSATGPPTPEKVGGPRKRSGDAAANPRVNGGIGSTCTIHGREKGVAAEVTLLELIDPAAPTYIDDVPAGTRAVAVRIAVKSIGEAEFDQTIAWGAKLVDGSDQQYEYANVLAGGPELGNVRLATGERRVGTVVFLLSSIQTPSALHLILDNGYGPDIARWHF